MGPWGQAPTIVPEGALEVRQGILGSARYELSPLHLQVLFYHVNTAGRVSAEASTQ